MSNNRKKHILIILLIVLCLIYLKVNSTYSSYESTIDGTVESKVANWNILVNNTPLNATNETGIDIDSITWNQDHIREGKVAPGATGTIEITIDPTTTDVAFDYELTVIDKTTDENKLLVVTAIENTLGPLTQEGNVYKGTMSLQDIKDGKKEVITLYVKWEDYGQDTVVVPGEVTESDDFIEVELKATQRN